ncbi:hypothetical protein ARMGADRAFT_1077606 [Armillaria gallica]|uniref:Uncharacterized protein n=1 Tax=Armillaria gallica TaxID=47427 RepID=A0A2H3DLL0_ARMGA|nr:hypothetical protein ARMGADRAFT_1092969 [Armillaria gallica]PBK96095.1 hypothetical protein ARMGADRAFT_1077606 [Armillaria gallica]
MSHARTLLIAYSNRDLFLQDEDCPPASDIEAVNRFVGQKAWKRLVGYTGCTTDGKPQHDVVGVDMEALILLEMRMSDRSEDAGVDGGYPWSSDGPEGEQNSREGNESELEVGPEFDQEELAQWHRVELEKQEEVKRAQKVTRPKPKMPPRHTGITGKRRAPDDIQAEPHALRPGCPKKDTGPPAKHSCKK